MNHFTLVLAHGSLGNWDEVIFLSIAVIFLAMMGISWVRSRVSSPKELDEPAEGAVKQATDEAPDHYRLD